MLEIMYKGALQRKALRVVNRGVDEASSLSFHSPWDFELFPTSLLCIVSFQTLGARLGGHET